MHYEVIIEDYVLQVDVSACVDIAPRPGTWESDWDSQGTRELEFEVVDGKRYDEDGIPMALSEAECYAATDSMGTEIEAELWRQIETDRAEDLAA